MNKHLALNLILLTTLAGAASAHTRQSGEPIVFDEALRAHILAEWRETHPARHSATPLVAAADAVNATVMAKKAPAQAAPFVAFAPRVNVKWDKDFLFIESNGMPAHNMMVGITAWQQQVPLPQAYFGDNAWRIPLHPVPAKTPAVIEGRFLRGAIALAVNGIPIFNPQNNRGEVSYEIGELDQWGGHCGRADDYHYHIAPLHLQAVVGKGQPIAYALDGYPIHGLTEPDGSPVGTLDECHGHETAGIGYHYHASTKRPYLQSAFHGEVVEAEGQVDPQPRAQGVRPDTPPLRGAEITGFESTSKDSYKLSYSVNGDKRSISYSINADGTYPFEFDNGRDGQTKEVYTARQGGGGPPRGPGGEGKGKGKGKGKGGREGDMRPGTEPTPRPQAATQGILDLNGDGIVTAQEFADNAKSNATKSGASLADAMAKAKTAYIDMDKDRSGHLEASEWQGDLVAQAAPKGGEGQERPMGGPGGKGGGKGRKDSFVGRADQPRSSDGKFLLTSPVMEDLTDMPTEYTGDGEGATLPLAWKSAPAGTQGYALIMDHAAPGGDMKWYWTLYDLPANLTSLPKNAQGIGKMGTGFKGEVGYEPPHSKGPGAKIYVITLYALSAALEVARAPGREELLAAMKGKVLASSSLRVIHTSEGETASGGGGERPRPMATNDQPPARPEPPPPSRPGSGKGKGKGKGGPPGLIKPSIDDTMKLNVYADNWFMLYVNGRLVAVDPIQFTPHNVVSVDFLPEYPMTIAVLAKDNADPKTGMEYGTSIGDGGFILKFSDGTVTNATWKAKNFFHGPIDSGTANPRVTQEPLPEQWWAVDFDDSAWPKATEYTVEQIDPKQPYFDNDFEDAKFIWTGNLALDNTVVFRTRIERPDWQQRWNTKPDLDVTGAPMK